MALIVCVLACCADIPCCGMAGDRGMRFAALTAAACQHVNLQQDVTDGYSNSRTCEIGVSAATSKYFRRCAGVKQQVIRSVLNSSY